MGFIAAAKPSTIIALLDQLEALHAVLGEPDEIKAEPSGDYAALRKQFMSLLMLANSKCKQAKHWRAQSGHAMHQTLLSTAANVNAERDTNAMLTDALEQAELERDQLRGELEACKADAERYQFLRDQHWNDSSLFVVSGGKSKVRLGTDCPSLDRLDEIIDAARALVGKDG